MGITAGEKPGAELLAAIEAAEDAGIPVELIDRDVLITLRRAWAKMGFIEKFRVLDALLWQEDDEEGATVEELLEDSDMLSKLMEEAREVAPAAGSVLIDERDVFLAGRIQQIRGRGKILAIVGAGHLNGIQENLAEPAMETASRITELSEEPRKSVLPKALMIVIPLFLIGAVAWMGYTGKIDALKQTALAWLVINAGLTGLGVLLARGHPLSILVGSVASPITSLNPTLAAGWFAGYTQLKITPPTGGDAQEFLSMENLSVWWKNRVGKVLLVTMMGNIGSSIGTWIVALGIVSLLV